MPVLLGSDDPAHNVTILDQAGKAIEWNGEVSGLSVSKWEAGLSRWVFMNISEMERHFSNVNESFRFLSLMDASDQS